MDIRMLDKPYILLSFDKFFKNNFVSSCVLYHSIWLFFLYLKPVLIAPLSLDNIPVQLRVFYQQKRSSRKAIQIPQRWITGFLFSIKTISLGEVIETSKIIIAYSKVFRFIWSETSFKWPVSLFLPNHNSLWQRKEGLRHTILLSRSMIALRTKKA